MFQLWILYLRSRGIVLWMIWTWSCTDLLNNSWHDAFGFEYRQYINRLIAYSPKLLKWESFFTEEFQDETPFAVKRTRLLSCLRQCLCFMSKQHGPGVPGRYNRCTTHSVGVDPIFPSKIGVICRTLSCSLSSLFLVVIGLNQNVFWTLSQVDYFEQIPFTERFVIGLAWSILVQFVRTPLFLREGLDGCHNYRRVPKILVGCFERHAFAHWIHSGLWVQKWQKIQQI